MDAQKKPVVVRIGLACTQLIDDWVELDATTTRIQLASMNGDAAAEACHRMALMVVGHTSSRLLEAELAGALLSVSASSYFARFAHTLGGNDATINLLKRSYDAVEQQSGQSASCAELIPSLFFNDLANAAKLDVQREFDSIEHLLDEFSSSLRALEGQISELVLQAT